MKAIGKSGMRSTNKKNSPRNEYKEKENQSNKFKDKKRDSVDKNKMKHPELDRVKKRKTANSFKYHLEDATDIEAELIKRGTKKDQINAFSLLCAKNPSPENYKQLLSYMENERNDVIYLILKNIKNILKEKTVEDYYIKGRIIKSYSRGVMNPYIKDKIVIFVGKLALSGVYTEEFISILCSRLLEKGKTLEIVEKTLEPLSVFYGETVIKYFEDFYYQSDSFRRCMNGLKFLSRVLSILAVDDSAVFEKGPDFENSIEMNDDSFEDGNSKNNEDNSRHAKRISQAELKSKKEKTVKRLFEFYTNALTSVDPNYPKEHISQMKEIILMGLSSTYTEGSQIDCIDELVSVVHSPRCIIAAISLLIKIKSDKIPAFVLRAVKSMVLRDAHPYEGKFLNQIEDLSKKLTKDNVGFNILEKLLMSSHIYDTSYIVALLILISERFAEKGSPYILDISTVYSLHMLKRHYNAVVRYFAGLILEEKPVMRFDPYDHIMMNTYVEFVSDVVMRE